MPIKLSDVPMTPHGARRWLDASEEERLILSEVFHDAISRPERVGSFKQLVSRLPCGRRFESVRFRFGYAHFCVYILGDEERLHDLWLDPIPD